MDDSPEYNPRDPKQRNIEDYQKVALKLGEAAAKLGLYIQQPAVIIPQGDEPVFIQIAFAVGEASTERVMDAEETEEGAAMLAELEGMMAATKEDDVARARRETAELLEDFGKDDGGFGEET